MTETANPLPPATMDVSDLLESGWDSHDPVWWGNLLAILIETTTVALMVATYFYLRRNFDEWPPPRINELPILYKPVPNLIFGTLNLLLLVGSCVVVYITDMTARLKDHNTLIRWLLAMLAIGCLSTLIRVFEFNQFHFKWNDNAYGSVVWWMLSLHMTYILAGTLEYFIMWAWIATHDLDEHHALDVTLAGGYWYWTAGTWVILYIVLYICPRIL